MPLRDVDPRRLRALVAGFPGARVTVVGDLIVDHYIWGHVQRISPEAPVPVVEVREESRRPGGAANVAHNIRRLGGHVELAGSLGDDDDGRWLAAELAAAGVGTAGLVTAPGRPTTVKTRIIAHGQQVVRVDRERKDHLPPKLLEKVKRALEEALGPGGVAVVSDYGKGFVSAGLLNFLREEVASGVRVLVDPKSRHFATYRGFTLVTPNQREAEAAAGVDIEDDDSLRRAGERLLETLASEALLITRGEAGMSLFADGKVTNIPTAAREVYDVTGAGDTVLATLALALAAGASFLDASVLANLAAGVVVGEVGTSTVSARELRQAVRDVWPRIQGKDGR